MFPCHEDEIEKFADLRVAARFTGQEAALVNQAIKDANTNIKANPAWWRSENAGMTASEQASVA
jgi:hypothetical protein